MELTPTLITPERCEYDHPTGFRIIVDWINPTSRGIDAWCEVRLTATREVLTFGRYDLMGSTTVERVAKLAHQELPFEGVDLPLVRRAVAEAVYDVIQLAQTGEETVDLASVAPSDRRWLLPPLIESTAHSRLIAAGGSFKSLFALAVAVTVATGTPKLLGIKPTVTGPILYLDWEADAQTHNERLNALCKSVGMAPPKGLLWYEQHRQALHRSFRSIAAKVAELKPLMIVVDSNAMARGMSGDGPAEDSTLRMFAALRMFGRPALIVDHKSDEKVQRGKTGGYGSVFNRNLARLEWEVMRVEPGVASTAVAMKLLKANNSPKGIELGFRYTINATDEGMWDTARIEPIDPASVAGAQAETSHTHTEQIVRFLSTQTEAKTVVSIAAATGLTDNALRSVLGRHKALFENVTPAGTGHWRLAGNGTDEGAYQAMPETF